MHDPDPLPSASTDAVGFDASAAWDLWQLPSPDHERRLISGTAAAAAREIGVAPIYVRVTLVLLTLGGGWGLIIYLAMWAAMERGGVAHTDYEPIAKGATPRVRLLAFAMVSAGLLILSNTYGISFLGALVWPSAFVAAAIALGMDKDPIDRLRGIGERSSRSIGGRLGTGLALLFAGIASASFISLSFWEAVGGIAVAGLVLAGASLVFAPELNNLAGDLASERRRRIRSEERADMAAHLHDSVLQTLSLIQKRSHDASVISLARRQERELRSWLFEDQAMGSNVGFRSSLESSLAEVEDLYQVPIELVVVGDCPSDPDTEAVVKAAREAASNAAQHSGAQRVDVFAETTDRAVEVYVRDTGCGFDLASIDADRAGVRDSITGRMTRHGGTAVVYSEIGGGTEVELRLPREPSTVAPEPEPSSEVETF